MKQSCFQVFITQPSIHSSPFLYHFSSTRELAGVSARVANTACFFRVWRIPGGVFALSVRKGAATWSQGFFTSTQTSNHAVPLLCRADWRECRHRRRPTSLIEKRELLFWTVVQRWSKTPKCSCALIKPRSRQKTPGGLDSHGGWWARRGFSEKPQ